MIMRHERDWLLMTYYCPTYGSSYKSEPLQLSNREIVKAKEDLKFKKKI